MAGTKSRQFAIICTILMIITSVYLGGLRSLSKLQNSAMVYYEEGTNSLNSLEELFQKQAAIGENLITIASRNNIPEDDKNLEALESATDTLSYSYFYADTAVKASNEFQEAFNTMVTRLEALDLSNDDQQYVISLKGQMASCVQQVSTNPYNEEAKKYNEALEKFPANILSDILGMEPLGYV